MKDEVIFVRRRDERKSITIYSTEDLDLFLDVLAALSNKCTPFR